MKPRILILSASVGAGHLRAAEAVEHAARELLPDAHVENHDVLDFTNSVFRRLYSKTYLDLVGMAPHLLGYIYDWLDQPSRSGRNHRDRLRLAVEKLNLRKFERFLAAAPWDIVINTHFLPAELIAKLKLGGQWTAPQVTVCTDFLTHRLWVNAPCEQYFCATSEGAEYLVHWGVERSIIDVTGIPIDPAFSRTLDTGECRHTHGIVGDRPVVLQMCGGFGVGPVEQILGGLLAVEQPLEIVVICGRNEELKSRLSVLAVPGQHRLHLIGFTRQMHELMACADLLVSKPGGLTTSEALAMGLPIVVCNPIPGQESQNSDFLLEQGAGLKVHHPSMLAPKLTGLLKEQERLARMQARARALGKPRAAFDVVEKSLELIPPPTVAAVDTANVA